MVFKGFFLLSRFHLVFLPTTLASLPPGVMLLNRRTTLRDSATDIKKTSRKGAQEQGPQQTDLWLLMEAVKITLVMVIWASLLEINGLRYCNWVVLQHSNTATPASNQQVQVLQSTGPWFFRHTPVRDKRLLATNEWTGLETSLNYHEQGNLQVYYFQIWIEILLIKK